MDLKVFITTHEAVCDECNQDLGRKAWITLEEDKGALCLGCADLDHLLFLPAGDAALTRRSRKYSSRSAVVLRWSRARKRYERQGLLVEKQALEKAEQECLEDGDARARRNARAAARRAKQDQQYVKQFAARVRELFPGCPSGVTTEIAEYACQKYSGRIGRSASAKALDEQAIRLAVTAHIRHVHTEYDALLSMGIERGLARDEVAGAVADVLRRWESGE
jgi:hypothetical protein